MARLVNVQNEKDLNRLRESVERTFGKRVLTQTDCIHLVNDVREKTAVQLSQQTLRRFFGLIHSSSFTSLSTLNVLCQLTGHKDWINFVQSKTTSSKKSIKILSDEEILFIKDFYSISLDVWGDKNFYNASFNVGYKIVSADHPDNLLRWLAANPTSQQFFYEYFPYLDGLAGNYASGIKTYLKYKKTTEAKAFGHSLLLLGGFLKDDWEEVSKQFQTVKRIDFDLSIHPLPLARLIGNRLLYYSKKDRKLFNEWLDKGVYHFLSNYHSKNPKSYCFPGFHFMLADYLLLVDEFEKALYVIESFEQIQVPFQSSFVPHDNSNEIVKLQKAIALTFLGYKEKGRKLMKEINPQFFWFFNKKFYWTRYLLLQLHLTKSTASAKKQKLITEIKILIADTNFNYFNRYLKKYL